MVASPIPESLSPLRWRWILLTTRHREVRFIYWPPQHPTGYRNLRMFDRDGYDIGRLVWVVCDACCVGSINKISIDPDHHRQGLGRRMLRRALDDGPGYAWQTTHQSPRPGSSFPPWMRRPISRFPSTEGSAPTSPHRPGTGLPRGTSSSPRAYRGV
jgi:GNAT superfamily N-acetyltransferase